MLILLVVFFLFSIVCAINNGVAKTPPMGWNSKNTYGCNINQSLIKKTADQIIKLGLDKKGYSFVNIDDCWQISRNLTSGQIIEDKINFPTGMSDLSNYVHNKRLKFGLSSDAGNKTCQGRPGSFGYQTIDSQTYAKWQVDFLKYDNCDHSNASAKLRYYAMYKALNNTRKHLVYSISNWGQQRVWQWGNQIANMWRTTIDIKDEWKDFLKTLDLNVGLQKYSSIGGWNDLGILQVGNGGMNLNEYYAQFALWCVLKSPLMLGFDLDKITKEIMQIIGNQQLIAINQDAMGIQGSRIKSQVGSTIKRQVWGGSLANNKYVIVFFNRGQTQTQIQISLKNQLKLIYNTYTQRDPIRHINIGVSDKDILSVKAVSHSVEVRILQLFKNQNLIVA